MLAVCRRNLMMNPYLTKTNLKILMIYILIITAALIIFFTDSQQKIIKKINKNWLDDLLLNNYKLFIGLLFLIFTILFWRYSCFFISYNC